MTLAGPSAVGGTRVCDTTIAWMHDQRRHLNVNLADSMFAAFKTKSTKMYSAQKTVS